MQERFDLRMAAEFKGYIKAIRGWLQNEDDRKGRGRKVTEADAVRYAIHSTYEAMKDIEEGQANG